MFYLNSIALRPYWTKIIPKLLLETLGPNLGYNCSDRIRMKHPTSCFVRDSSRWLPSESLRFSRYEASSERCQTATMGSPFFVLLSHARPNETIIVRMNTRKSLQNMIHTRPKLLFTTQHTTHTPSHAHQMLQQSYVKIILSFFFS